MKAFSEQTCKSDKSKYKSKFVDMPIIEYK